MKKSFYVLVIILVLCVIIYFLLISKEKKIFAPQAVVNFIQLDSSLVDKIEFTIFQTKRVFEKREGNWFSLGHDSIKLDNNLIGQLLSLIINLEVEDLISTNPKKQIRFQVDTLTGTRVDFIGRGENLVSLVVGKTSPDFMYTYVRKSNSDEVWSAKGFLSQVIGRRLDQWRDRHIFQLDTERIQEIEFMKRKGSFKLIQVDTLWKVSPSPYYEKYETNTEQVNGFLGFISSLRADAFAPKMEIEQLDFRRPVLQMKLTLVDGYREVLTFTQKSEEDKRYFVKKGKEETIYQLYQGSFDQIDKRMGDFK